jgi:hypothetical protein
LKLGGGMDFGLAGPATVKTVAGPEKVFAARWGRSVAHTANESLT